MAALPCARASTADESAVAAEAWLLSGEEVRFSTIGSFAERGRARGPGSRCLRVRLAAAGRGACLHSRSGTPRCHHGGVRAPLRSDRWFGVKDLRSLRDRAQDVKRGGYAQLFADHVTQADEGCDFDFLHGAGEVPEPAIH